MTVRTSAKQIRDLGIESEQMPDQSGIADSSSEQNVNADESETSSSNESGDTDEADNEFDENESENDDDDEDDGDGNAGWADAFAKVLQQERPKNKKYLVLSKAKKLSERDEKKATDKQLTFEIADKSQSDDEDIKPDIKIEDAKPTTNELELAMIERKERNNKLQELRVKPAAMDRERERSFKRIATKGVVQLFNAVRTQQRDLVDRLEKAGPLDHKRDAVLNNINKRQFLDMLMGGKRAKSENVENPVKDENVGEADSTKPSQWSVLRDDFMTNKKLKHWDNDDDGNRNGDTDEQTHVNNDMDSDSE